MRIFRITLLLSLCWLPACKFIGGNTGGANRPTNEPEVIMGYLAPQYMTTAVEGSALVVTGAPGSVVGQQAFAVTLFRTTQADVEAARNTQNNQHTLSPTSLKLVSRAPAADGSVILRVENYVPQEGEIFLAALSHNAAQQAIIEQMTIPVASLGQNPVSATQTVPEIGVTSFQPLLTDHVQGMIGKVVEVKPDGAQPDVFSWINIEIAPTEEATVEQLYPNLKLRDRKIYVMLCRDLTRNPCKYFVEIGALPKPPAIEAKLLAHDQSTLGQYVRVNGYVNTWAEEMNGYRIIAYDADMQQYKKQPYVFNGKILDVKNDTAVSRMLKVGVSAAQKAKIEAEYPDLLVRGGTGPTDPAYVWAYACICKTVSNGQCTEFDHAIAGRAAETCTGYLAEGYLTHEQILASSGLSDLSVDRDIQLSGAALFVGDPKLVRKRFLGFTITTLP